MKRDSFSQLPSHAELQGILDVEVKRGLPVGKENNHYVDFSSVVELARQFDIDAQIFIADLNKEDIVDQDLFGIGKLFIEEIKTKILNQELSTDNIEACNSAYDYLAEEDQPANADLIFVYGAKTLLRIEKAVELYKRGFSERIVVSGRSPFYADNTTSSEAEMYAKFAIENGVPQDALIVEDASITIPDNVRASLNLLDEKEISYSSIILVNSPYTQRRGWAHFKKYVPDTIKLIRVNSGTGDKYKRDAWYKNSAGIDVVLGEYLKMKVAVSLNTA